VFGSPSTSEPGAGALCIDDLTVRLPAMAAPILRGVSLQLAAGAVGGLLGPSGAGKTTLLHAVSGLLPWMRPGRVEGSVDLDGDSLLDLDPGQRAHLLASCLDRAGAQLFLATPRQEVAAARRLHGPAPLLDEALEELGLGPLLDRRTGELSSGERQRLAVAVALAGCPRPLLLDEPTAHLDGRAVAALCRLLGRAANLGGSVLLAEQAGWRVADPVASWWRVSDGGLAATERARAPEPPAPTHSPDQRQVLALRGVAVERGRRRLLSSVDLELRAGEVVVVSGPNGAGKSTLAEVVAGLRRPARGEVEISGTAGLMLPTAELQLFATSVEEEVSARGGHEVQARVLRRHRLEHLAARAPWTLSRGERQRLVHAALDLQRPDLMVVDEPAQGLDPDELGELVRLIHRRAERGRAYLVISHREELAAAAHRHLRAAEGRLEEV
jgi:energy-coupling factor transport system ATP-binding protein